MKVLRWVGKQLGRALMGAIIIVLAFLTIWQGGCLLLKAIA